MKRILFGIFIAFAFVEVVLTVKVDMGQCTCNWATSPGGSETLSSYLIGGYQNGKFYEKIRGFKGEMGRPGESGAAGERGIPGVAGLRGPPAPEIAKNQQSDGSYSSCSDISSTSGESMSGIYTISPRNSNEKSMQLYCESTIDGGGWALVASIHENNIDGKCTSGDKWSSEQGFQQNNITSSSNWENLNTFGFPEGATSADYKSEAFFNLMGNDVMIWHVPNDSEMSEWKNRATSIYYTNNNFLSYHGGTLQALFSKYYPMKKVTFSEFSSHIKRIGYEFDRISSEIRNLIPSFNMYSYDDRSDLQINDGGGDMYDTGNKVYYKIGDDPYKQITYETLYKDYDSGTQIYSQKSHPFITYMWISNTDHTVNRFALNVRSGTGADSSGYFRSVSQEVTLGDITCKYHSFNVYGTSDPSICEVYFYCYSEQLWESRLATSFVRSPWSSYTDNLSNGVEVQGSPESVLLGYTLLSRSTGVQVTAEQINAVMNRTMNELASLQTFPTIDCEKANYSLAVPVHFEVGSSEAILNDIPPQQKPYVEPGFLHFRPVSSEGIPNAICPGIKSSSCHPFRICIGGIGVSANSSVYDKQACGDFAGWNENLYNQNTTGTEASESSTPLNYLKDTILIFTR